MFPTRPNHEMPETSAELQLCGIKGGSVVFKGDGSDVLKCGSVECVEQLKLNLSLIAF